MAKHTEVARRVQTSSKGIQALRLRSQATEALQVSDNHGQGMLHTAECKANL